MWGHYLTGETKCYPYLLKSKINSNFCFWPCFLPKIIFANVYVPFPCNFFEAFHWPSDHMISSRLLIRCEKKNFCQRQRKKNIGATICIGGEISCLPYAGFLIVIIKDFIRKLQLESILDLGKSPNNKTCTFTFMPFLVDTLLKVQYWFRI